MSDLNHDEARRLAGFELNGLRSAEVLPASLFEGATIGTAGTPVYDVKPGKAFGPGYFDEEYFRPGPKSDYKYPYELAHERPFVEAKAEALLQFNPSRVLDVGCAKGFLVEELRSRGVAAAGCDISFYAVAGKDLDQCDIRDGLPYDDGSFDLIHVDNVLEHIEDEYVDGVFEEFYRVGTNWLWVECPVTNLVANTPEGEPSHVNYMPPSYWISRAWSAGWSIELRESSYSAHYRSRNAILVFTKGALEDEVWCLDLELELPRSH